MKLILFAASGKQKNKRRPRGRPDNDTISKDRLTTTECQDDKDETSSTTTESSTGDGDEKVSWNLCHFIYAKTKVQGPVVQNFVSLTMSLSPQFVNCILTSKANTLLFFVEKM